MQIPNFYQTQSNSRYKTAKLLSLISIIYIGFYASNTYAFSFVSVLQWARTMTSQLTNWAVTTKQTAIAATQTSKMMLNSKQTLSKAIDLIYQSERVLKANNAFNPAFGQSASIQCAQTQFNLNMHKQQQLANYAAHESVNYALNDYKDITRLTSEQLANMNGNLMYDIFNKTQENKTNQETQEKIDVTKTQAVVKNNRLNQHQFMLNQSTTQCKTVECNADKQQQLYYNSYASMGEFVRQQQHTANQAYQF